MSDVAIRVENIGKKYILGTGQGGGMFGYKSLRDAIAWRGQLLRDRFTRKRSDVQAEQAINEEFWALKDVSFEVKQGEVVGIIGRNGSGKSTLLKILSRITEPTEGQVELHGRVGSLLEVGTGFHPELTGRENIYMNGAILGMRKVEIDRKFDEIVAFAETEKFLDTPVKRYSSGMYVRLAFAVAAHLEPEILLVDEVLAVGDAAFQKKCLGKMGEVAKGGRTVLFVSHNMGAIEQLCSTALLLSSGELKLYDSTSNVVKEYTHSNNNQSVWMRDESKPMQTKTQFTPLSMSIIDNEAKVIANSIPANQPVGVLIECNINKLSKDLTIGFALYAGTGELLFWSIHTDVKESSWPELHAGHNELVAWIPAHYLNEGDYRVELIASIHYREWLYQPGVNSPTVSFSISGGLSESPYWMLARPGLLAPVLPFTASYEYEE